MSRAPRAIDGYAFRALIYLIKSAPYAVLSGSFLLSYVLIVRFQTPEAIEGQTIAKALEGAADIA